MMHCQHQTVMLMEVLAVVAPLAFTGKRPPREEGEGFVNHEIHEPHEEKMRKTGNQEQN